MTDRAPGVVLLEGAVTAEEAGDILDLIERLGRRGLSARLLCASAGGLADPAVREAPGLDRRLLRPWATRRVAGRSGLPRPDLIHALRPPLAEAALDLAERWRVPYLLTVDEFPEPGTRLRIGRPWARAIVAGGTALADDLARNMGVPRSLIEVIPPGLEPSEREAEAESPGDPPAEPRVAVVGAAGRMAAGSGLAVFLGAARRVIDSGRDAEFVVAGAGPGEHALRRLAERLGLAGSVTFCGPPSRGGPFWRVLDVFCHPAPIASTALPLAQALAHGVPSIAADATGARDWLLAPDGTPRFGRLVPPGDPEALSSAILDLLSDPPTAGDLGRAGRDRIAGEFSPDRQAAALSALYRRITQQTLHRPGSTRMIRRGWSRLGKGR